MFNLFNSPCIRQGVSVWVAGRKSGFKSKITQNLPFTLIPQAGVTIWLAALADAHLLTLGGTEDSLLILNVVALVVVISQIIGPLLVKRALINVGEINNFFPNE